MNIEIPDDLMPLRKAAGLAQCHWATLMRWVLEHKVTGYRRGGRWFVSRAQVLGMFRAPNPPSERRCPSKHLEAIKRLKAAGLM